MNTNQETMQQEQQEQQQEHQDSCCECPICYDCMTDINITTTQCGHKFHSSCIFNNLKYGLDCPLCRTELVKGVEENEDEDEDEESYYSSDDEEDDEEEDDDNNNNNNEEIKTPKFDFTMEQVAQKMQKMNISYADFIGYMMFYSNKSQMKEEDKKKYTKKYSKKVEEMMDDIIEYKISVDYRDTRTYAEVVSSSNE